MDPIVEAKRSGEPHDRLTRLCAAMTETLEAVETPWANTTVTVELFEESGKTRCVLTHAGFP